VVRTVERTRVVEQHRKERSWGVGGLASPSSQA